MKINMENRRKIRIINLVLVLLSLILLVNLFFPLKTITGNFIYSLDKTEPLCYFKNGNEINKIPLESCCLEVLKSLKCENSNENSLDFKCLNYEGSQKFFLLNSKALNFCKKEGYYAKDQ
mgnify:CR=1 FL=1